MPELPEVETIKQGLCLRLLGKRVLTITIRQHQLRWPIPKELTSLLPGQKLLDLTRRGKYLLFTFTKGTLIIHLGMSGVLQLLPSIVPPQRHSHVDISFTANLLLRFTDPRRFGCMLWTNDNPEQHPLLAALGPEPLAGDFTGQHLYKRAQRRHGAVKSFIMDHKVVAGVGNIYANEALFMARIHPEHSATTISPASFNKLAAAIKKVLRQAIAQGGTTLRDYRNSEGKPGHFQQALQVYGRGNLPCTICAKPLQETRISQRSTVFCNYCQN